MVVEELNINIEIVKLEEGSGRTGCRLMASYQKEKEKEKEIARLGYLETLRENGKTLTGCRRGSE